MTFESNYGRAEDKALHVQQQNLLDSVWGQGSTFKMGMVLIYLK